MGPSSPIKRATPQFSALVYCGQTAGCISILSIPLGVEVGLGPDNIVLDAAQLPPKKGARPPNFRLMSIVTKRSPMSATAELYFAQVTLLPNPQNHPVLYNAFQSAM